MTVLATIRKLQSLPYKQRMKVFRTASLFGGLAVVAAWFALGSFIPRSPFVSNELVQSLQTGAKNASQGFSDMQKKIAEQRVRAFLPDGHAVTVAGFSPSGDGSLLNVELKIDNPTDDILDLLAANQTNVYLLDGENRLAPKNFTTDANQPVPAKLLSRTKVAVQAVFDRPQNPTATLTLADLYFESRPDDKFTETFELTAEGQVQGLKSILLPRQ